MTPGTVSTTTIDTLTNLIVDCLETNDGRWRMDENSGQVKKIKKIPISTSKIRYVTFSLSYATSKTSNTRSMQINDETKRTLH